MCGINGLVFQAGVKRSEEMLKQIKFLFDQLMVETQARGEHATGLSVFRRDGSYDFHKAPTSALKMVGDDETYKGIVDRFSNETSIVIAHTRWYTKGKPENNLNNHPFDIGNVIGVHNGTVANDDSLFAQNKDNFTRIAEVDSEIVYQLINHYNKDGITYEGLEQALEKTYLRGLFALAFAHKSDPFKVHIVKQEKPMHLAYWKEAGLAIFNSQDDFIENAFALLKRAGKRFGFKVDATVEYLTMKEDTYVTIDAGQTEEKLMLSEAKKIFIQSSATKTYYSGSTNTSTSSTSCGTKGNGTGNYRSVAATDSTGRVIEGELDELTGEVILFTSSMIAGVGGNDDGSEMDTDSVECCECGTDLDEDDLSASYNEGADATNSFCCHECYSQALNSVFPTA